MRAAIIACCDPAPILDPPEDVLDFVALAIEVFVVVVLDLAVLTRGNAWGGSLCEQRGAEPVAVIAFVCQQLARGSAGNSRNAPLWSLIWPSVSIITMGRPSPSQTACNFEFKPPLVRPIHLERAPLLTGWPLCGAP